MRAGGFYGALAVLQCRLAGETACPTTLTSAVVGSGNVETPGRGRPRRATGRTQNQMTKRTQFSPRRQKTTLSTPFQACHLSPRPANGLLSQEQVGVIGVEMRQSPSVIGHRKRMGRRNRPPHHSECPHDILSHCENVGRASLALAGETACPTTVASAVLEQAPLPSASVARRRVLGDGGLWHLGAGAAKGLSNPIGVRETAGGESLKFLVHIVLHAPDSWLRVIQQEVCSAAIAVVRKTDAARVGDDHS